MKGQDIMFQLRKCSAGAKGVFIERRPRSKYAEKQVGKSTGCGEKPLSSYVTPTLLRQECDTPRTQASARRIEEREFWAGWSVCPRWDSRPTRIFTPQHNEPGHSPHTSHHSAVQLLPRETSFKLRPDRPLQPVPHAVPCGSWG